MNEFYYRDCYLETSHSGIHRCRKATANSHPIAEANIHDFIGLKH
ncbi:hypothetical protein DSM3645_25207 [Blastopirellula marina DSM 3645]|uniref:Uncharacterized protein n=1 Tax=Blastopirellula marina DSM 3645 TaxID=314230 RepID=A4A0A9_9BACT|nr:hypothetical protein DSM3645_25207 [Blastopirellula marina DSM 3645]